MLQLDKFVRSSEDPCPKRDIFNPSYYKLTPENIPFTLELITLTDIVEENTPVEIRSDSHNYQISHLKRYLKYKYFVARIRGQEKSFAFGSLDFEGEANLFDGIIYVNDKLHFIEGVQTLESFNAKLDLAGKSALSDKWGTRKWVEEKKYLYYTEDDIEPVSHIKDYINTPYGRGKPSFIKEWRQHINLLYKVDYSKEWYAQRTNTKKVCSVNVLLDSYCMENVFRYNIKEAIHETIILYGCLDFLYRIIDFANIGKSNHFGFRIAKITVLMEGNNDLLPLQRGFFPLNEIPLADKYTKFISSMSLGDGKCSGTSFTFQNLEGTAGQAFLGSEDSGIFMDNMVEPLANRNMAFVNYMHPYTHKIRIRGSILNTLAHEIGHTFGAVHEESTSCYRRKYLLMAEDMREFDGFDSFKFSHCNVDLMKKIIDTRMGKFANCPHNLSVYYDNLVYPKF
ncbi:unnamed protein product [Gordionus sp. m RMFG-2023]